MEKLLSLYSNKWEEVEVDHSVRQAAKLLAQFLLVLLPEASEFEATHVCVFSLGKSYYLRGESADHPLASFGRHSRTEIIRY